MNIIDFFIGFTLMNAMPHFVIGIWEGRMLSLFGFGKWQNVAYSLLNFSVSVGLFLATYGFDVLLQDGIYLGAMVILLVYYVTGDFFFRLFRKAPAG